MIHWLSDWLRQIIFIILFATIVELLLPHQAMERYVRTVMGLFILMILLVPLLTLFHQHWDMDLLTASINKWDKQEMQFESVSEIIQAGGELKGKEEEESKQLLENRMAEMIKDGVEQNLAVTVLEARVETGVNDKGGNEVKQVALTILLAADGESNGISNEANDDAPSSLHLADATGFAEVVIPPIQPVLINLQPKDKRNVSSSPADSMSGAGSPATAGPPADKEVKQETAKVEQLIYTVWGIPPNRIQIAVVENNNERR